MRMNEKGQVYILEANALCGISDQSDSSVGLILNQSGNTMTELMSYFLGFALERQMAQSLGVGKSPKEEKV